jgi:periplasmic divalent cation tolerance protein
MLLFEKIDRGSKDIVFVYTTCSGINEARAISLLAVEAKLVISADYWIINSIYPWKGVIQEIDQYMIMFATQKGLSSELIKHIETEHSYDIPMIARVETTMTNQPYSFWVDNTLSSDGKYMTKEEEKSRKVKKEEFHLEKLR